MATGFNWDAVYGSNPYFLGSPARKAAQMTNKFNEAINGGTVPPGTPVDRPELVKGTDGPMVTRESIPQGNPGLNRGDWFMGNLGGMNWDGSPRGPQVNPAMERRQSTATRQPVPPPPPPPAEDDRKIYIGGWGPDGPPVFTPPEPTPEQIAARKAAARPTGGGWDGKGSPDNEAGPNLPIPKMPPIAPAPMPASAGASGVTAPAGTGSTGAKSPPIIQQPKQSSPYGAAGASLLSKRRGR